MEGTVCARVLMGFSVVRITRYKFRSISSGFSVGVTESGKSGRDWNQLELLAVLEKLRFELLVVHFLDGGAFLYRQHSGGRRALAERHAYRLHTDRAESNM
jgi:hypothetical protein